MWQWKETLGRKRAVGSVFRIRSAGLHQRIHVPTIGFEQYSFGMLQVCQSAGGFSRPQESETVFLSVYERPITKVTCQNLAPPHHNIVSGINGRKVYKTYT